MHGSHGHVSVRGFNDRALHASFLAWPMTSDSESIFLGVANLVPTSETSEEAEHLEAFVRSHQGYPLASIFLDRPPPWPLDQAKENRYVTLMAAGGLIY